MKEVCPRCGARAIVTLRRDLTRTVGNRAFVHVINVDRCDTCDFSPIPIEAINAFESEIATELALFGPVSNETFQFLRRAMGLDPVETASLLDVALEDVLAWDQRRRKVPLSAWFLLACVVRDLAAARENEAQDFTVVGTLAPLASTRSRVRAPLGGRRVGVA